jgi:carbon starvation protein CstA
MKLIEIFVLFGGGYISGLSIGSGFAFQAIRKLFADSWSPRKEAAWIALAMPNIFICTVMSVMLVAALVIEDQPGRSDFWPRFAWFTGGVLVGGSLTILAVHLTNMGARNYRKAGES